VKQTSSLTSLTSSHFWVWIPLLLLSAILFYGLVSLPPLGDTNPTFHVASRYLDRGADETGFSSSFLAVLLDYRSFYLVLLSLFFFSMTLTALLFCVVENVPVRRWEWVWVSLLSSVALFVLGWIGLKDGSNFMDYEFWSRWERHADRVCGAWVTSGVVLLTITSSLMWAWKVWMLGKENHLDP
jgi:hypothetical protein